MEVEIISKQNVSPASPTAPHLKTYKFSILDQTFSPFYVQLLTFFLNDLNTSLEDVISTRCQSTLKNSLSQTLSQFYPLAGRIKDNLYIDCNDEGVSYIEARVNYRLSKLLAQPDNDLLFQLIPQDPISADSMTGNHVVAVQVNIFDCGGIVITTLTSHKILDATTTITFLKAWAAKARMSSMVFDPKFIAPSLFPHNPSFSKTWPGIELERKFTTRRFLFDSVAIAAIKNKVTSSMSSVEYCTTFEAVSALFWRCIAKAAIEAGSTSEIKPSFMSLLVNLRRKTIPPLPSDLMGNVVWYALPGCVPAKDGLELHHLVNTTRKAISEINNDFVEEIKGEKGFSRVSKGVENYSELDQRVDFHNFTSMINSGYYELDFGWGKPVWFYFFPPNGDLVVFADTRSGDGIEVTATLREEDMALLERDPEILAFTTMNPSPLELCNSASRSRL